MSYTQYIKQAAYKAGFFSCGIAKCEELTDDAIRLEKWLHKGFHAEMSYMERNFDVRINPEKLLPNAKSIITLLVNYYPNEKQNDSAPKVAKYAYGDDYHLVIKKKLFDFIHQLQQKIGAFNARGFVDSAPILERTWAVKSGLGWIGKNGNLITKQQGSFFFIATIVVDITLDYDSPFVKDYCGTCTQCIDQCPTNAILPNKEINASQCISYFTIELKREIIPSEKKYENWIFGCDVCQDVCPWNRFSKPTEEKQFKPLPEILNFNISQWNDLNEESFKKIFKNSPLQRSKYKGIMRNLHFIKKENNSKREDKSTE